MVEYMEEYLVALGFDLNSEEGKEYLRVCQEIERRNKELEKSDQSALDMSKKRSRASKTRISDTQDEIDKLEELDKASRKAQKPQTSQPVTSSAASSKTTPDRKKPVVKDKEQDKRTKKEREEVNILGDMEKTVRQIGTAWVQLEHGNIFGAIFQGAKGVQQFKNMMDNAGSSMGSANTKAGTLKKTLSDLFGTQQQSVDASIGNGLEEAAGADAGAEAVGTGISAGALAAGAATAGIAAGIAVAAKAVYSMGDGLANANINVENMARQMWITDDAAMRLNNTLQAMGKSTADLNTIALNPALREQFETLQNQQKTILQAPAGYQKTMDSWVKTVQTPFDELKNSLGMMFKGIGADVMKDLGPAFSTILNGVNDFVSYEDIKHGFTDPGAQTSGGLAPQNSSYTNYASNASVQYAPQITVNATSNDPQSIATATHGAVQNSFNEAALIASVQGMSR